MSLALISNATAIAKKCKVPFQGTGGTEPYVYSVVPGGIGGTINASTGVYTAPSTYKVGVDTIKVIDDDAAEATKTIMVLEPIGLVCEIIQRQLGLSQNRVRVFDQKFSEPTDYDMFVVVQELGVKAFGSSIREIDGESYQFANFQSILSIDVKSRSDEAMYRKEEVVMALKSVYSEQQQELNSFQLASIPFAFVNLSNIDGAAIPYQYNISVNLLYAKNLEQSVPYYDTFEDVEIFTNV